MHLVVVSTYPPRRCGLAAFTADLRAALRANLPHWRAEVHAVDREGLSYPPEVTGTLRQEEPADYRRAARRIAARRPDLVVIQHEYGIFGGPDGRDVCELAAGLRAHGVPYAVTLHSVLSAPTPGEREAVAELCRGAALVTCFTDTARRIAAAGGLADPGRIVVVPHGVPAGLGTAAGSVPDRTRGPLGPELARVLARVGDAPMLSTFGLLRPGKGVETAVRAMPAIVARHPDAHYLVAGATHPDTLRRGGESYRESLRALARDLGVAGRVRFVDAFLTEPELAVLLARTEVYLTPYRTAQQTCSGALTFALAAGCAVVSTSYPYAMDLLNPPGGPERGAVVPFDDPAALAEAASALLGDPPRLSATRAAAAEFGASLTWPAVGARFGAMFAAAALGWPARRPARRLATAHAAGPLPPAPIAS
jgi:glycosyltransferase involved in cell wall biosynthesis